MDCDTQFRNRYSFLVPSLNLLFAFHMVHLIYFRTCRFITRRTDQARHFQSIMHPNSRVYLLLPPPHNPDLVWTPARTNIPALINITTRLIPSHSSGMHTLEVGSVCIQVCIHYEQNVIHITLLYCVYTSFLSNSFSVYAYHFYFLSK